MIPDYQTLMRPVLMAAREEQRKISDVVEEMSELFQLPEDERALLLPSGKQTAIANRVHWARSYLKQAGLVSNPKRGFYELTADGQGVADDPSIQLNSKYLERFDNFQDFLARGKDIDEQMIPSVAAEEQETPDESIQIAYQRLNASLAANLIEVVREATPAFFEVLIVELLLAMGYGGSWKEAGRALGQTGDNGIDGVIDQDPLGVDQIYLQAKRYAEGNNIGASDIRDFFGALNIKKANKGIFVTTSSFSPAALQTVKDLGSRIVLIDGKQLARLMIRYNVGCRDKDVLHIKQIDEAFFEGGLG
ncbi:restriction endonuclease [Puniceibacterium confluentis]|uniref:restriction endonuclease n=1 Tax=Puniceibacterium confluentis TaxID=1958944 RepID=UPI0011B5AF15|nr:restriction endonuclease [Puniceibacterium confluentis]